MGSAELGRELGDAGGPLVVAGVATAATLGVGYLVLALLTALLGVVLTTRGWRERTVGGRGSDLPSGPTSG